MARYVCCTGVHIGQWYSRLKVRILARNVEEKKQSVLHKSNPDEIAIQLVYC
jgi:hypothetical protein